MKAAAAVASLDIQLLPFPFCDTYFFSYREVVDEYLSGDSMFMTY
jgi:hypothetical protein